MDDEFIRDMKEVLRLTYEVDDEDIDPLIWESFLTLLDNFKKCKNLEYDDRMDDITQILLLCLMYKISIEQISTDDTIYRQTIDINNRCTLSCRIDFEEDTISFQIIYRDITFDSIFKSYTNFVYMITIVYGIFRQDKAQELNTIKAMNLNLSNPLITLIESITIDLVIKPISLDEVLSKIRYKIYVGDETQSISDDFIKRYEDIPDIADEYCYRQFGFKYNSAQSNFLKRYNKNKIIAVSYIESSVGSSSQIPTSFWDEKIVSCAFGEILAGNICLWHIDINKNHELNRNKCWGVYGVMPHRRSTSDSNDSNVSFWTVRHSKNLSGNKLSNTKRTLELRKYINGSPNPFAVDLLTNIIMTYNRSNNFKIYQNESLPCANLFYNDQGYNQSSHPSIYLIYKTLDFDIIPGLTGYFWNNSRRDILSSYMNMTEAMEKGLPVITFSQ
tara:strand:+ start:1125 stop:2459 length:1335 start_codon:yes stop_codon:yes gene_type:complete